MRKYLRISMKTDTLPVYLILAGFLAFYVMFFLNIFVGGMGGVPSFISMFLVFYLLRSVVASGKRIGHQLAISSKTEVTLIFLNYTIGYLILWIGTKLFLMISHINGWGNIKGLAPARYLELIYGTTMLERWAYMFAGILMFAFIGSLFPLIMIRKKNRWLTYLFADCVFFMGICVLIQSICKIFIEDVKEERARCVLDYMLLCEIPKTWQSVMYVLAIVVFTFVILFVSYQIGIKEYGPKPGTLVVDEKKFLPVDSQKQKRRIIAGALCLVVLVGSVSIYMFVPDKNDKKPYQKVADCLTEDSAHGPMIYQDAFYVPISEDLNLYETEKAYGYIGYKGEKCDSRFYELVIANLLYQMESDDTYVQMYGADKISYKKLSVVEEEDAWNQDSIFLLWDEEWVGQASYTEEPTGYSVCETNFILGLEQKFGKVTYSADAFSDYDAYFTIRGYKDLKDAIEEDYELGDWVGCILVKDNNFYYGNYDNQISGVLLQQLLDILGGNEK